MHITSERGDAIKFIESHGDSAERIICMGGDGTLSEVVSGLIYNGLDVPIGYIPAGTANDFASSLGLSKNMMQAADNIINGEIKFIDAGKFNGRYFGYVASFGVFTQASYNTSQSSKNMLGHFAYIIEGMKELANIRAEYIKLEATNQDNEKIKIEGEYIFGAALNTRSIGGVLSINTSVDGMSDGFFDVMLIKPLNKPAAIWECAYSLMSQNYNSEYITFFKADKLAVRSSPDLNWSLDGEREKGADNIIIENICCAVKIIK